MLFLCHPMCIPIERVVAILITLTGFVLSWRKFRKDKIGTNNSYPKL
jgi:D-alanyl-lipoteichoic acid acyltransferase DltB (MBOAT superfamily)